MAGLTTTGFLALTRDEILTAFEEFLRAKISTKLDLSEDQVLGSLNAISADHLEQLWQLAEEAYQAFDVANATDDRIVALGVLLGVPRRGATTGLVSATCQFSAGGPYAAGALVASVQDEPSNVWANRDAYTAPGAGFFPVVFESLTAGASAVAPAGTLTVQVSPPAGWVGITNSADAQPGLDIEPIDALRVRMSQSVARGGQHSVNAIRSALLAVPGVLSCNVFENITGVANLLAPAHSIRAVVWDGSPSTASNADLAQAIWDNSATYAAGVQVGTAVDDELGQVLVNFDRATAVACTMSITVVSASKVAADDVRRAVLAEFPGGGAGIVGVGVSYLSLVSAPFAVPGVDDLSAITLNGGTVNLPALPTTVYQLTSGNITVLGDVT